MQQEPEIQKEVRKLTKLLRENETIIRYKELEEKIQQNQYLAELREKSNKRKKMLFILPTMTNQQQNKKQSNKRINSCKNLISIRLL